jgi:hypothetical protein
MVNLTEGRIVLYVIKEGEYRPAFVVKVWSRTVGTSNLQVFVDGTNDGFPSGENVVWRTSVVYSEDKRPGTWHWLETE